MEAVCSSLGGGGDRMCKDAASVGALCLGGLHKPTGDSRSQGAWGEGREVAVGGRPPSPEEPVELC